MSTADSELRESLRVALSRAGVEVQDGDLEVACAIAETFEPGMARLDSAEVTGYRLESDLDPSRSPARREA